MPLLRTAVLGYGRSGSTMHAGAIETGPDFEMTAVCDIDPDRRREAEERFGCPVYDDYHRMLEREDLDLVAVITRSDQHCEMTCDCLAAGVNVLVTKPWCVDEAEARMMMAARDESGAQLLPWLPARWGCVFRRLQQIVDAGSVGSIFCVRHSVGGFADRDDWQTLRQHGGGYLLNWGPHIVDTAVLLAGDRVRSVHGWMKQVITSGDAEDVFMAELEMANGVRVVAERTVAVQGPHNWLVQGDCGTIVADGCELTTYSGEPRHPTDPTDHSAMQYSEPEMTEESVEGARWGDTDEIYAEIAGAVRGESPFAVSPRDALRLTRVLDAIRKSSEHNEVVRL